MLTKKTKYYKVSRVYLKNEYNTIEEVFHINMIPIFNKEEVENIFPVDRDVAYLKLSIERIYFDSYDNKFYIVKQKEKSYE
ncbi:P10 [Mycoplasma phage P1]|uniref:P10 n=1 Tax=Mycoplasma phage P1 TaxID=2905920 RepID=Q9FZR5_9CAUD|nr:P10 [Mycoplasma phage P1]AAG01279.1 P10 [Mycoplasma phage P1]